MRIALLILSASVCFAASKKSDEVVEKFDSGKIRSKTKYLGNDLLEAEAFYENGKTKLTTKKAGKSAKGYGPDNYTFKEFDDDGHTIAEGSCWGPPLAPLDPYEISKKPKLHYGSENCNEITGTVRKYSDQNEMTSETKFKDGKRDGEATYTNEKTIQKITYKENVKVKFVETDKITKKILKSEEYYSDGSKK